MRHQGDLPPQFPRRDIPQVDAVDGYGALLGIVESRQEVERCRLSATVFSHQGHRLAEGDVQRYAVEGPAARDIGEAYVVEADLLGMQGDRLGVRRRRDLRFDIEDGE